MCGQRNNWKAVGNDVWYNLRFARWGSLLHRKYFLWVWVESCTFLYFYILKIILKIHTARIQTLKTNNLTLKSLLPHKNAERENIFSRYNLCSYWWEMREALGAIKKADIWILNLMRSPFYLLLGLAWEKPASKSGDFSCCHGNQAGLLSVSGNLSGKLLIG